MDEEAVRDESGAIMRLLGSAQPTEVAAGVRRVAEVTAAIRPTDEPYRACLIPAGAATPVLQWLEQSALSEEDFMCGCRAVRGLAGSQKDPALALRVIAEVSEACMQCVIRCATDPLFSVASAEQGVAALMNLLRPVSPLHQLFCTLRGVELVVTNLRRPIPLAPPGSSLHLYTCFALLSMARDVSCHHAFRAGRTLDCIKALLGTAGVASGGAAEAPSAPTDAELRACGTMLLALLSQSFDDPADGVELDVQAVEFIVDTLQQGLHPVPGRYYGWRTGELVGALFSLSAADRFKGLLADARAVPALLEVLESPAHAAEEGATAAAALHNLCYHADGAERARIAHVLREPPAAGRIAQLLFSADAAVRLHAKRIALYLGGGACVVAAASDDDPGISLTELKRQGSDGSAAAGDGGAAAASKVDGGAASTSTAADPTADSSGGGSSSSSSAHDGGTPEQFDVMISYAWASQRTILRIAARLREAAGLRVWLDVDHMGRQLMDSMAEAVEGARVVLLCCSSAYKASPNCRREAEYAVHLGKPLVIANLEGAFVPRGWLGLHVAGKIWCDFRDEAAPECFERGMATLLRQLAEVAAASAGQPAAAMPSLLRPLPAATPVVAAAAPAAAVAVSTSCTSARLATAALPVAADRRHTLGEADEGTTLTAPSAAAGAAATSPLRAPSQQEPQQQQQQQPQPQLLLRSTPAGEAPLPLHACTGTAAPLPLLELLRLHGHRGLAETLQASGAMSPLAVLGLQALLARDVSAFHELTQRGFACGFADSLALSAALSRSNA